MQDIFLTIFPRVLIESRSSLLLEYPELVVITHRDRVKVDLLQHHAATPSAKRPTFNAHLNAPYSTHSRRSDQSKLLHGNVSQASATLYRHTNARHMGG